MAIVTRQEFADLCGKKVAIINTNISRGKIHPLKGDKSMIDTEFISNKQFYQKCRNEKKIEEQKEKLPPPPKPKPIPVDDLETEAAPIKSKRRKKESDSFLDNDLLIEAAEAEAKKKIHDAQKAEWQAEKERLNVEKMMGELMPVSLVNSIVRTNVQHIFRSFESDLMNISGIYCDILAGGDRGKQAEIVEKLRHHLSYIINATEKTALQEIKGVISDFAESRNPGQKK